MHIRIIQTRVSYVSVRYEMFLESSFRRFMAMAMSTSAVAFPVCVAALFFLGGGGGQQQQATRLAVRAVCVRVRVCEHMNVTSLARSLLLR